MKYICLKNICDKYGLHYFAIGGTCIGAIRHQGFIPWDDDLDVAMPIVDYLKFFEVAGKELEGISYSILGPKNSRHYFGEFNKLQDTSTTFIEEKVENYSDRYSGIFIDIFPVCGLPDDIQKRESLIQKNILYKRINACLRFPYNFKSAVKWQLPWILVQPIKLIKGYDYFTNKQFRLFQQYNYQESQYIYFPWRGRPHESSTYKDVFYREDFQTPTEVKFEDTTMYVPNGYDRYLTMDFTETME